MNESSAEIGGGWSSGESWTGTSSIGSGGTSDIGSGSSDDDDGLVSGILPLHLIGMGFAVASSLCSTIGLLIQKHSAAVEAGKPMCRRWRFWVGFSLNLGSEAILSSTALYFTPLSLIAPMGGLTVIFNALLVHFGVVCGIREKLSRLEWSCTIVVMMGVSLATISGPGSTTTGPLDLDALPQRMARPAFASFAATMVGIVVIWLLVSHSGRSSGGSGGSGGSGCRSRLSGCRSRYLPRLTLLRGLRPADDSLTASVMSGTTAACCGSCSVLVRAGHCFTHHSTSLHIYIWPEGLPCDMPAADVPAADV